jgi:hypothetical protein
VEFGESTLLGRTARDTTPTDSHAVSLPQLEPARTYYFRLVSKDRAGNVTVNDNGGALYTFTTLMPLLPPWTDNMERGNTNWTVYTVDESERGWALGVPGALQPAAHSPTNAWASNLTGDFASQIESYLISPAIQLTGGNTAKLKFWHAYDFTATSENDIYHGGELLLITGNAVEPISLGVYSDDVVDWEAVEVDLTPHLGKIVYLAWHYFLFSLDAAPRTGWLLDDVSVTVSNTPTGTLIVSNNLWQSSFTLDGTPRSGRTLVVTNAATGQHIIAFNPVPFYNTPAPQTNTLATGGTITFSGNYTFADANANGISDAYELERFGQIDPIRTELTDTDNDGQSDWAEFVAGTDPKNPVSSFHLDPTILPGDQIRLAWPSAPGHGYRLLGSTNAKSWSPFSDWLRATGYSAGLTLPPTTNGAPNFFHIEAQP